MLRALTLGSLVSALASTAAAQSFWLIEPLSPANRTQIGGLSRDGTRLTGNHWNNSTGFARAFDWSEQSGRDDWGLSMPDPDRWLASDLSGDGRTQVGSYYDPIRDQQQLFRRRDSVVELLGRPGGSTGLVVNGADDRADAVCGYVLQDRIDDQAFAWTAATGFVYLDPTGILTSSRATAISADGSTVVGGAHQGAFRWTAEGGLTVLLDAYAADISSDGNFIVGESYSTGLQACIWNASNVRVDLGIVAGATWTRGLAVSDNGRVVVGDGINPGGETAPRVPWIWTAELSIIPLEGYLASQGVVLPDGWRIHTPSHISDDGLTIAGLARHATLGERVFVTTIPSPGPGLLFILAACASARRRR